MVIKKLTIGLSKVNKSLNEYNEFLHKKNIASQVRIEEAGLWHIDFQSAIKAHFEHALFLKETFQKSFPDGDASSYIHIVDRRSSRQQNQGELTSLYERLNTPLPTEAARSNSEEENQLRDEEFKKIVTETEDLITSVRNSLKSDPDLNTIFTTVMIKHELGDVLRRYFSFD